MYTLIHPFYDLILTSTEITHQSMYISQKWSPSQTVLPHTFTDASHIYWVGDHNYEAFYT